MEKVFGIKIPYAITYRIMKDTAGFYHITYKDKNNSNCTVSFFHTLPEAKEKLKEIIKESD